MGCVASSAKPVAVITNVVPPARPSVRALGGDELTTLAIESASAPSADLNPTHRRLPSAAAPAVAESADELLVTSETSLGADPMLSPPLFTKPPDAAYAPPTRAFTLPMSPRRPPSIVEEGSVHEEEELQSEKAAKSAIGGDPNCTGVYNESEHDDESVAELALQELSAAAITQDDAVTSDDTSLVAGADTSRRTLEEPDEAGSVRDDADSVCAANEEPAMEEPSDTEEPAAEEPSATDEPTAGKPIANEELCERSFDARVGAIVTELEEPELHPGTVAAKGQASVLEGQEFENIMATELAAVDAAARLEMAKLSSVATPGAVPDETVSGG